MEIFICLEFTGATTSCSDILGNVVIMKGSF